MFSISQMGRHGSRMAMADVDIQMATIILTMVKSDNSVHVLLLVSDDVTLIRCIHDLHILKYCRRLC